jgi:hypothetical protein
MQNAPNNLASFLLIGAGAISAPLGIGIVLILMGVVLLREANGELSFPRQRRWIKRVQTVQFWRMTKL